MDFEFFISIGSARSVLHDGVSLWNHSCRFEKMQEALFATMRPRKGQRKYDSVRVPREPTQRRRNQTLGDTFIRSVVTKVVVQRGVANYFPMTKSNL